MISRLLANSFATLVSRLVLGGVFLYAGVPKIFDPGSLAASIRTYELGLPEWFISFSAYLLPYVEVFIGLYLIAGLFTKLSALVTTGLMFVFFAALLQGAVRGLEINCGCFAGSAGAEPSNLWLAAARDIGLITLGLHIILAPLSRFSVDALLRNRGTGQSAEDSPERNPEGEPHGA